MLLKGSETNFSLITHLTGVEIISDLQNEDW